MPWEENNAMEQRMKFIVEYRRGEESMAELCRRYGIQRRIGYKWLERFARHGVEGLVDRNRAPRHQPQRTPAEIVARIVELRDEHALWGAPKIRAVLAREQPERRPPATSTIGEILCDAGLIQGRKKRRRTPPHSQPLAQATGPNEVVSIDFKGWFRTGDGTRVDPLTVIDNHSRYALCCQGLDACDGAHVRAVLETTFRAYGLPRRVRSDNGAPFASRALGGLSRLSVWLLKLGVEVERIPPATPSANGRQERFHLTLKQHAASPPAATLRAQQRALRRFRREYNEQRPHQALGQRPPASVYEPSPRPFPARLAAVEYPPGYLRRKVGERGEIYWRGARIFVSEVLAGEPLGLEAIADGEYRLWFAALELGRFDERLGTIAPVSRRRDAGPSGAAAPPHGNNP